MNQIDTSAEVTGAVSRRGLVKGAAWAVPVMAVAVATPLAAASVNNSNFVWTAAEARIASLNVLDGGGLVAVNALMTLPTQVTLNNGAGAITNATATVTITVNRPSGITLNLGTVRGFGVYSYNGVITTAGSRTATYQSALGANYGLPITTFTTTMTGVTVASGGSLNIPILFGLTGTHTSVVGVSALAAFPVTITVVIGGKTLTASSLITVPAGLSIL